MKKVRITKEQLEKIVLWEQSDSTNVVQRALDYELDIKRSENAKGNPLKGRMTWDELYPNATPQQKEQIEYIKKKFDSEYVPEILSSVTYTGEPMVLFNMDLLDVAKEIEEKTGLDIEITAGNDYYHLKRKSSRHKTGGAVDFVIKGDSNGDENQKKVEKAIIDIIVEQNFPHLGFLNEFKISTGGDGGHFHISLGPPTEVSYYHFINRKGEVEDGEDREYKLTPNVKRPEGGASLDKKLHRIILQQMDLPKLEIRPIEFIHPEVDEPILQSVPEYLLPWDMLSKEDKKSLRHQGLNKKEYEEARELYPNLSIEEIISLYQPSETEEVKVEERKSKKKILGESSTKILLKEFTNVMVMCTPWNICMEDPDGVDEHTKWFVGRLEHNENTDQWYPYSIDSPKFKSRDEATTYMLGGGRYNREPLMEKKKEKTKKFFLTEGIKDSWNSFISIAGREKRETIVAIRILKKLLTKQKVTDKEIKYLKSQSTDIAKIVGVMSLGAVSMAIPLALEKILNKWEISIMPKSQTEEKEEEPVESFKFNKKIIKEGVIDYLTNTVKDIKEKNRLKDITNPSIHSESVERSPQSKILYSAVVLDEESKNNLLSYVSQYVDIPFDWKGLGEHMTITFKQELPPQLKKDLDEVVSLTVKSIGVSDDAIAVEVEGYPSQKEMPHITIAIPPEGSPVDSNNIKNWEKVEDQLIIKGKVSEIRT